MRYVGSEALPTPAQRAELDAHLKRQLHRSAALVARRGEKRFEVDYIDSGKTALRRRLGDRYKKPKLPPGEAPASDVQQAFVAIYIKLRESTGEHDAILVMGATHPQHNPALAGGWTKCGQRFALTSDTGRRRLNINGVSDWEPLAAEIRYDDTVDAPSTIALFAQLEAVCPKAATVAAFCDNARYNRSRVERAYLKQAGIDLQDPRPYAPNLNRIEGFWKFFKRHVLYNRFYWTFADYKAACRHSSPASVSMASS